MNRLKLIDQLLAQLLFRLISLIVLKLNYKNELKALKSVRSLYIA